MTGPRYLTTAQLQEKLGNRSRASIYRDIAEGRIPKPIKMGQRCYWPEDGIDAAMAALAEAQSVA